MPPAQSQAIQFVLQGHNNETLEGTLILEHMPGDLEDGVTTVPTTHEPYDEKGASAYATVVIAVYGFSIVLLIASHIFLKKKADKRDGDEQQINKYLQQVPDLKEKSKRESFRRLKRSIIPLVSIGVGHDLSTFAQTPPGFAVRQGRAPGLLGDFDNPECNSRRSSYENDPNRPLLDWIQRETARRASIVSLASTGAPQSPSSQSDMPVIYEEGSKEDVCNKNDENQEGTEQQDSELGPCKDRERKTSVVQAKPDTELPECNDLWLVQDQLSQCSEHSPPLPRGSDAHHSPPNSECSSIPSPRRDHRKGNGPKGHRWTSSPRAPRDHSSPRPDRGPYKDGSPQRYQGSYASPAQSPLLPRFPMSPASSTRKSTSASEDSMEEAAEDLLQITCV